MDLILSGKITLTSGFRLYQGLLVHAVDDSLGATRVLAVGKVNRAGEFSVVVRRAAEVLERQGTVSLVVVREGETVRLQQPFAWTTGGKTSGIELRVMLDGTGVDVEAPRSVYGEVLQADGSPATGLVVRAFDRDLRSEELLGETRTGRDGRYSIGYRRKSFARAEKETADVLIRVYDGVGHEVLFEPRFEDIHFSASANERIDVSLRGKTERGINDFDHIASTLKPLIGRLEVASLTEDSEHRDVSFLSREGRLQAEKVEHFIVAHRLGRAVDVGAAAFYALLRKDTLLAQDAIALTPTRFVIGVGDSTDALLRRAGQVDSDRIAADIEGAIEDAIVAPSVAKQIAPLQKALARFAGDEHDDQDQLLERLGAEIQGLFTDPHGFSRVVEILDRGGDLSELLTLVGGGKPTGEGERATPSLRVPPSLARVIAAGDLQPDSATLAGLPREDWVKAVHAALPAHERPKDEVIAQQAERLHRAAQMRNPGAALRARIDRGHFTPVNKDSLAALLEHRKPGREDSLDLARADLNQEFELEKLGAGEKATLMQLKRSQRMLRVAPDLDRAVGLVEAGIGSATDIVGVGRARFVDEIGPKVGLDPRAAEIVFAKARARHDSALILAGELRSLTADGSPAAMAEPANVSSAALAAASGFPSIATLFGSGNPCQCQHCRSVYSPAAYLVELIEFLGKRGMVDLTQVPALKVNLAREILFGRRPDVPEIDLNCANAEVPLPYIDLVCEILEEEVAPSPSMTFTGPVAAGVISGALLAAFEAAGWKVTDKALIQEADVNGNLTLRDTQLTAKLLPSGTGWTVVRTRQTHGTAAELAAAPEYVNEAAYALLESANYAFALPFDLAHTEATAYFNRFGLARDALMRAFETGAGPSLGEISAEALGLSDAERTLITQATVQQDTIWGPPGGDPIADMAHVSTMLDKTGISYDALNRLLQLGYVDPDDVLFVRHLDLSCDLEQKRVAGLDADALDRIHRFLRMQRATGWKDIVLDQAIMQPAIGHGDLDEDGLIAIEQLVRISRRTGLQPEELTSCFGTVPHARLTDSDEPSFYERVFLDKAAMGFIDEQLLIENVASGVGSIAASTSALAAVLRLSEEDFTLLAGKLTDDALNFANLSRLYGAARLISRVKTKASDLLVLVDRTGIDPFAGPAEMLAFLDAREHASGGPVRIADMRFFLEHAGDDIDTRSISDAKISELLETLQLGYQAAYQDTHPELDSAITAEELRTPLREMLQRLPGWTEDNTRVVMRMYDADWASPPETAAAAVLVGLFGELFDSTGVAASAVTVSSATPTTLEPAQLAFGKGLIREISGYLLAQAKRTALDSTLADLSRRPLELVTTILDAAKLRQPGPTQPALEDLLTDDALIDTTNVPPTPPTVDEATFPDQYRAARLLHKLLALAASTELSVDDLAWLLERAGDMGWVQLDGIPYATSQSPVTHDQWRRLSGMLALFESFPPVDNPAEPGQPVTLTQTLDLVAPGAATTRGEWLDALARLTGFERETLDELDTHFGWSAANLAAWRVPETWESLLRCMAALATLGMKVLATVALTKPVLTPAETSALRAALKSRYAEDVWLNTHAEIMNAVRPRKRDSLVAYLLAERPTWTNSADLYDYFLIDTQMESKMPSSRIVQAHGTIQLFVERSRMGIEQSAAADSSDVGWEQWIWMRNYQVWVANRKVWVTPENWIRPELLDEKSPEFQLLEDELLQSEINEFTTQDVYIRYLERLDAISFLEVITVYHEQDLETLHVFARTKGGDPAQYFHREFVHERYWTPWRVVDLDITSNSLLAFSRNGRLHLAWPVTMEETDPEQEATTPAVSGTSSTSTMEHPASRLRLQLAVSEYANGMWKPRKISQDAILSPPNFTTDRSALDASDFNLLYNAPADQIWVFKSWIDGDYESHELEGGFAVTGCKGYPEVLSDLPGYFGDFFPDYKDALLRRQRYFEIAGRSNDVLAIRNMITYWGFVSRLDKTPGEFRVTHAHQITLVDVIYLVLQILYRNALGGKGQEALKRGIKLPLGTWLPYFYEDSEHAYVVVPGLFDREEGTEEQRTFSDILRLINDVIALLVKYAQILNATPAPNPADVWHDFVSDPATQAILEELQVYSRLSFGEQFRNLYHPLLCRLRTKLYRKGVGEMMRRESQLEQTDFDFDSFFAPTSIVAEPYPVEDVEFQPTGGYSLYNWELFFHAPLMLARRLASEHRFEEAMVWYHRIFNPTGTLEGDSPQKYWVTRPFFETTASDYTAERIENLLHDLADPASPSRHALELAVDDWRENPFRPHVVARFRTTAYQRTVVMNYVETLIEWGDHLFRQDTMESIVQATQRYILAGKLLGPKPRVVASPVEMGAQTYTQLAGDLDGFGNALVELENYLPDFGVLPEGGDELPPPPVTLASLYFCVPPNEKMLAVWDTVEDRLFKIRNSENIDGVERLLSLFAPPIDPDMLVRAAASGLSLSAILAGLNAPLPGYRFAVIVAQADEFTTLVGQFGSTLLSVLEKRDVEALSLLRNELEEELLAAQRDLKVQAIAQADAEIEALAANRLVVEEHKKFYDEFERLNVHEQLNLDKMKEANDFQTAAGVVRAAGGVLGVIPNFSIGGHGVGGSPAVHATFGGSNLASAAEAAAHVLTLTAGISTYEASRATAIGEAARRTDDAGLQSRTRGLELDYIDQQIVAATLRRDLAQKDLDAHDTQSKNAAKMTAAIRGKYTNQALYEWMADDVTKIYYRAYQLAFACAKRAERCLQHELGGIDTFLDFGYWDSRKKGLQAANKLAFDIKRMKAHHYEANKREYEITKHVSLRRLDALALLRLRTTGACTFEIPEVLYDLDHAGHYFRRIKSISVTLPCVAGPYSSVSAKLTQLSNRYRMSTASAVGATSEVEEYEETGNDTRFIYDVGSAQSIATSSGQNDPGLFELDFRDDRYLPFEGTGAVGSWRLELPDAVRQFDYDSISDAIIHVRYTAREGGSKLRQLASSSLQTKLQQVAQELGKTGMHVLVDLRRDDFDHWHQLTRNNSTELRITADRLPYFVQGLSPSIGAVTLLAKVDGDPASFEIDIDGTATALGFNGVWGMNFNDVSGLALDTPFTLTVADGLVLEELSLVFEVVLA